MANRLFWRLYVSMSILAVACIALAGFTSQRLITRHEKESLQRELTAEARLIQRLIEPDLSTGAAPEGAKANEKIQQTIKSLSSDLHVRTTIIMKDGTVVAETDQDPSIMANHLDRPEFRDAMKTGVGVAERPSPTEHILMLYVAVRVGTADDPKGVVRCAMPSTEVEHQLAYFTNVILLCSVLGVVLALLVSFFIGLKISLPIVHMTDVAMDIAEGHFEEKAKIPSIEELGQLAEALNAMRATLVRQIRTIEHDHRQLETIVSAMTDGVVALDEGEHVIFMNDAAARALDTTRELAVGKPLWEVCRSPALADFVAKARSANSAQTYEWSLQDVRLRQFSVTIVPAVRAARAPGGEEGPVPAQILVFHDVTALRKLERMRIDFIANVSHELKSPLTSIKGFVETLMEGAMKEPAKAAEFLEIIHRQSERLDRLVADLLELSTIEAPGYVPEKQSLSLADIALKMKETLAQKIAQKNLRVEIRPEGEVPPVMIDKMRMEQVFLNLLDNAVKYTDPGGGVTVNIAREDGVVKVIVRDTGIGIPGKDLPRIFERFYRVDKARSREMGGTGLGLAIVKHIILQHGGDIHAESTLGKGTAIIFTLPA